jgi:hypothetical protein
MVCVCYHRGCCCLSAKEFRDVLHIPDYWMRSKLLQLTVLMFNIHNALGVYNSIYDTLTYKVLHLKSSACSVVRSVRWFDTDVSGVHICPTCNGQAVQEDPWRWHRYLVPKRRYQTTSHCVTTQKTDGNLNRAGSPMPRSASSDSSTTTVKSARTDVG